MAGQQKLFTFNIGYTVPANKDVKPEERLSAAELFQGIKHGGRYPGDFGDFVQSCDIVSGDQWEFVRELGIRDGAVHIKDGTKIVQDVSILDGLKIVATTKDTGAKSTLVVSSPPAETDQDESDNPYLTLYYELRMTDKAPVPGSQEEQDIKTNYRKLAKNMVQDSLVRIRKWKQEGKLAKWAEDSKNGVW